jgi:glucan-binding YG repeat protein
MDTTWDGTPHRYWFYVNSDGSIYKGWVEDDGKDYSVDPYMDEGPGVTSYPGERVDEQLLGVTWQEVPHYFVNKDGSFVQNGWASTLRSATDDDGNTYYWRNWYYADGNGELVSGWNQIDGKWYFFGSTDPDEAGLYNTMNIGLIDIDGTRYLLDKSGARVEGWNSYSTQDVDKDGKPVTGREWRYFDPSTGAQVMNGWQKIDGKWYIFSDGVMQHDTPVVDEDSGKEYYLGTDGAMVTGWVQDDAGEWYNYGDDGALVTDSWIEDANGSWYYVDANGEMARNEEIDGYYVGTDGAWIPD